MLILTLITGLIGLILNYRVVKEVDWKTPAFSFHRHFQFALAGLGAATWTYCLVGFMSASDWVVLTLLAAVLVVTALHHKCGSEKLCNPIHRVFCKAKNSLIK